MSLPRKNTIIMTNMLPIDKISKLRSLIFLSLIVVVLKCNTCTLVLKKKKKVQQYEMGLNLSLSLSLSLSNGLILMYGQKKNFEKCVNCTFPTLIMGYIGKFKVYGVD